MLETTLLSECLVRQLLVIQLFTRLQSGIYSIPQNSGGDTVTVCPPHFEMWRGHVPLVPPGIGAPANMNVFRRDRLGSKGGGVFIAVSDKYIVSHQPHLETNCEITWVKLETPGNKSTYIGVFYRPHENDSDSLENLNTSLEKLKNTNSNIYIGGDFNLPGIDWNVGITKFNSRFKIQHDRFLEILNDHNLCQVVKEHTRGSNILDLFLTNNPSLIIKQSTLPGLGESDHDVVQIESTHCRNVC